MTLEQLHSRLQAYLAQQGGDIAHWSLGPLVPLTGGWASSLYTVTRQTVYARQHAERDDAGPRTSWVLKLYTSDARGRDHATREGRALTHLREVAYPVPGVIVIEPDAGHLGRPFLVMEHVPGRSLWAAYEAAPAAARAKLTRSFSRQLVALHSVDPRPLEPTASAMGEYDVIDSELEQLQHDSARSPHRALEDVVLWLKERKRVARCERPVVLHRDYQPWNVLVDGVDGGERLCVLDWDWGICDPRFDLAWACTLMQRSGHHTFASAAPEEYGRHSGRPLEDLAYFEVLTTVRWLLNVLTAVQQDSAMEVAGRADFRAFLDEPVQQAQVLLRHHTRIPVSIWR